MHNWRRNPSSNWWKIDQNAIRNLALFCGAIWRRWEKPQHRCTTTIPHMHFIPKDVLENLFPVWLLVRTNLFIPSRFRRPIRLWHCCLRYIATCGKKLYRCTSTFSALLRWNFVQISQLSIQSGAHKLFCRVFGLFTIFDLNFATIVVPSSDKNDKYVVHLKGLSILKRSKTASKSTH